VTLKFKSEREGQRSLSLESKRAIPWDGPWSVETKTGAGLLSWNRTNRTDVIAFYDSRWAAAQLGMNWRARYL
jgi:hypothetical protein